MLCAKKYMNTKRNNKWDWWKQPLRNKKWDWWKQPLSIISALALVVTIALMIAFRSFVPLIVAVAIVIVVLVAIWLWYNVGPIVWEWALTVPRNKLVVGLISVAVLILIAIFLIGGGCVCASCSGCSGCSSCSDDEGLIELPSTTEEITSDEPTASKEDATSSTEEETTTEVETTTEEETTTKRPSSNGSGNQYTEKPSRLEVKPGKPSVTDEVTTTIKKPVVKPTVVPTTPSKGDDKEEQTTTKKPVVVEPSTEAPTSSEKNEATVRPSNPFEEETTTVRPTQKPIEEQTTTVRPTQKPTEETTTVRPTQKPTTTEKETTKKEEETTTKGELIELPTIVDDGKPNATITISYTKGASVANVLVTFDRPVENPVFKCWWYTLETKDFTVRKNSDRSYSIKVSVPENYKGKLLVGAYTEDGFQILRKSKIINNLI